MDLPEHSSTEAHMQTEKRYFYGLILLLIALLASGAGCNNPRVSSRQSLTLTPASESNQGKLSEALTIWESRHITDYQITVDIFSSYLAPPCQTQAVLYVKSGNLDGVKMIATPPPVQLPNGRSILNPECSDYSRYVVDTQFKFLSELLQSQFQGEVYRFEYDPKYGYITHLVVIGGESTRDVRYSDFILHK